MPSTMPRTGLKGWGGGWVHFNVQLKSRQLNPEKDINNFPIRMTIRSDPVVQHFEPAVYCKICGGRGHSQFSCEYSCSENKGMSTEEFEFWKYIDQSEQPDNFSLWKTFLKSESNYKSCQFLPV